MIQAGAAAAVARLREGIAPRPLLLPGPITMAVEFVQSEMADRAALLPGASRNERRVEVTAQDMPTIYAAFRTLLALARG
jgi:D-aminopeptidase